MRQRKREEETEGNKGREGGDRKLVKRYRGKGDIGRDRCETEKEGGRGRGEQGETGGRHMERQM